MRASPCQGGDMVKVEIGRRYRLMADMGDTLITIPNRLIAHPLGLCGTTAGATARRCLIHSIGVLFGVLQSAPDVCRALLLVIARSTIPAVTCQPVRLVLAFRKGTARFNL